MKKKKPGFTLIEIIITLVVTVIVLEIAASMFITGNKVFSDSDVKSTLQIEAQQIQEKLSNIGMQAKVVQSVSGNNTTGEVNNIMITSYDKSGNLHDFEIKREEDSGRKYKDDSTIYKLSIGDQLISSDVKSMKIDSSIISDDENVLEKINAIEFNILLRREKGYSNIDYPINFKVTFRNKDD